MAMIILYQLISHTSFAELLRQHGVKE